MTFPWLNARSHFSLGESLATPAELVQAAVDAKLSAVCLTDTMSVTGMPELFTAAVKAGIKPIIGVRLRVVRELTHSRADAKKDRGHFLRALILDEKGWEKTLGLLSLAFDADHFYERPRLLLRDVLEAYRGGGAIITLGDAYGALGAGQAIATVEGCREHGIPLYADLTLSPTPRAVRLAHDALALAETHGIPALIAPPAFYTRQDQAGSLDLMASVASNFPFDDRSARHPFREHVIRDLPQLAVLMKTMSRALFTRYGSSEARWQEKLIQALRLTKTVEADFSFVWNKMEPSLPRMHPTDEFGALVTACMEGWKARFLREVFGHRPTTTDLTAYRDRLAHELGVIKKLGFAPYFLLVAEITTWAKSQGIRVGPGRGSVGGSLIAYLLGITDVDPLRFGLLFERFINPERIDLPDADLDFASLRREEVVQYIRGRFGDEYVAGVVNYNTMGAAGALKDVSRMLLKDTAASFAFSKIVPKEHGKSWSLEEALAEVPEIAAFEAKHPEVVKHALNLEGKMRAFGKHAAGLIVAGVPIRERAVIERRNDAQVINWDKRLSEEFGLVKMDILGLSTLDMLDISLNLVRRRRSVAVDLLAIPLDDEKTLQAFGRGETVGVFQMEASGARRMLKSMAAGGTLTFDDIVAANALNRPGPIEAGLVEEYIKRRNGQKAVTYAHPAMEDALKETYGVLVYQEQAMKISKDLSGFTGAEADTLRKAIGKKSVEMMEKMKEKFIEGALAGYAEVELEDGRKVRIHRSRKFKVKGSTEKKTIDQIMSDGLDVDEPI